MQVGVADEIDPDESELGTGGDARGRGHIEVGADQRVLDEEAVRQPDAADRAAVDNAVDVRRVAVVGALDAQARRSERAVHGLDLEEGRAGRVVGELEAGSGLIDGRRDLAAGGGVDRREDVADGRGSVDADAVDRTIANLDLEVVQIGRLRGLEAELRDRLVRRQRCDGEAGDGRVLGAEDHLVPDVAGLELAAETGVLQRLVDVDHQVENVGVALRGGRGDGDRCGRAAVQGHLEDHVRRRARQGSTQDASGDDRRRRQAGIGDGVHHRLRLETELGGRRVRSRGREREPGHARLADQFEPALVRLRQDLAAEAGGRQRGVDVRGEIRHREVGRRAGGEHGDGNGRAVVHHEVEIGVGGQAPVDRVGHQRGRRLDRHAVAVVQLLQQRRAGDRLARVRRAQVGTEGHREPARRADHDRAVAVDVEQRAEVELEVDRKVQVDEVVRELDRVAKDLGCGVVVRIHQPRIEAQDFRQQGRELVGRPEAGRIVRLQQLRDVVADLGVVGGRGLREQHLGDGSRAGAGDAERKTRIAAELAVDGGVGAGDDRETEADGGRRLRCAESELGQAAGVAGARGELERGDGGILGDQADAPVAAFGADHAFEAGVGERLVEVRDQGGRPIHVVVAVVEQ